MKKLYSGKGKIMRKIKKIFSTVFTVLLMMLSITTVNVFASSSIQDGLEVSTATDKENYKKDEQAISTIFIRNTNGYNVEDIQVSISLPEELSSKDQQSFDIPLLKAGESKEYKVTIQKDQVSVTVTPNQDKPISNLEQTSQNEGVKVNVKTDDNTSIVGWIVLVGVSSLAIILLRKHHKGKQFMILALVSTMTLSGLTMRNVHAESSMLEKQMSLTQKLVFDNQSYNIDIDITYFIPNGEVVTKGEVTREEWVTKLVDLFDYGTNLTTYSFADYKDAKNPDKIETAIQYFIVDIKDNESFKPNEYATREFVAYTTMKALRLFNTSNGALDCSDKDSLQYPNEDYLAIQNGMLNLINNQFKPNQYISNVEVNQVIKVVKEIIDSTKIDETNKDYVDYQDNVIVIENDFEQTANNIILIDDDNNIQKGDLVVVNGDQADGIAMKVENVQDQGDQLQIQYSQPSLEDILESLHVEGIADNSKATFIPADGVVVENQPSTRSRARYDSLPLDKELKLTAKMNDLSAGISLNLNEIQYRFDVDYGLLSGLQVHDAYLALDTDINANITYQGSEDLIEREETEKVEKKIGDINVPLQFGFNASFEVYAVATIDGKIEINVTLANKIGFQYINNNFRSIAETKTDLAEMEISASARFGIQPEAGVEWLGFDIANVNGNVGIGADGSVKNQLVSPYQFCIDGKVYLYATVGAELIPDVTDKLKISQDIFTSSRSPFKFNAHFEETGRVDKCTRKQGSLQGIVKEYQTDIIISNAQVQIYQETKLIDTLNTDLNGEFISGKLDSGKYTLVISALGYETYKKSVEISSGKEIFVDIFLTKLGENSGDTGDEDISTDKFELELGKSYRVECINDAMLNTEYLTDCISEFYYSNDGMSGAVLNDKDMANTVSMRTMKKGDFIDVKLKAGQSKMYAFEEDNFYEFFKVIELDHDPLKKIELSSGSVVSLDNQYIGNKATNITYGFLGDDLSGARKEIDYYWNSRFGWDIRTTSYNLKSNENFWSSVDEGCIHEYTINSGKATIYLWYEDAQKLVINE